MRFFRSLCMVTHWIVALAPLSLLCWFLLLAQWIHSESGYWPHTFLDDAEHYGYENNLFDCLFTLSSLLALITVLSGFWVFPTLASLWISDFSTSYRKRWLVVFALSWGTLLFARGREFYPFG